MVCIQKMQFNYTTSHDDLKSPALSGDVGMDLSCISIYKKLSSNTIMYDTGISVSPPSGYYFEVVPRSSMIKYGYTMPNSMGIIDPGYTSTIKVVLTKIDSELPDLECPFSVCQLILRPALVPTPVKVDSLEETERGDRGFGSTGN